MIDILCERAPPTPSPRLSRSESTAVRPQSESYQCAVASQDRGRFCDRASMPSARSFADKCVSMTLILAARCVQ
jgi:hypothetical protein